MKKLAFGTNSDREMWKGCKYGRHAEIDAMMKLPSVQNKKKRVYINLIVIRVNKKGHLKNSKPCIHCIEQLSRLKNYKIKYVFYSDEDGEISKKKFSELIVSDNKYVSRRFRNLN